MMRNQCSWSTITSLRHVSGLHVLSLRVLFPPDFVRHINSPLCGFRPWIGLWRKAHYTTTELEHLCRTSSTLRARLHPLTRPANIYYRRSQQFFSFSDISISVAARFFNVLWLWTNYNQTPPMRLCSATDILTTLTHLHRLIKMDLSSTRLKVPALVFAKMASVLEGLRWTVRRYLQHTAMAHG